jgi:opacity protein-like surface antigen
MSDRARLRITQLCGATVAIFGFVFVAAAQEAPKAGEAPEDYTPPPASTSATDEQPPAEKLPPCEVPPPAPPPVAEAAPPPAKHTRIFAPGQVGVTTGAGPANYFGSALNSTTDVGAGWDARVTFGTRSIIALEAGYVGASNNVDMAGGDHARLNSNGVDGDLRLQIPTVVEPYIFGGVGYNHMTATQSGGLTDTGRAGPINSSDDQVTVPAGAGLSGYLGKHTTLDLRGTYRYIPDNGLTVMSTSSLHQWVAQAHVGYVF